MMRFDLGLYFKIQKLVSCDKYSSLDELYKRAVQVGSIIKKEKQSSQEHNYGQVDENKKDDYKNNSFRETRRGNILGGTKQITEGSKEVLMEVKVRARIECINATSVI